MQLDNPVLIGQLEGLRRRLLIGGGCWFVTFCVCYGFAGTLFGYLSAPVQAVLPLNNSMVFLSATEPILTYLKLAAVAALFLCLPVLLWQLWGFIAPMLKAGSGSGFLFVVLGSAFFLAGSSFGFIYIFPLIFSVLIKTGSDSGLMEAMLSMGAYLSLAMNLLLAFGMVFELPLFLVLLSRLGFVGADGLKRNRKYMLIVAFIFGAVFTPGPDVLSQCALAIPFIILYEIGILGVSCWGRKKVQELPQ